MEHRIKLIWILSLASMFFIVAGQCYWLLSQYEYTNEEYSDKISKAVTCAAEANDSIRTSLPGKTDGHNIHMEYNSPEESQEVNFMIKVGKYVTNSSSAPAGKDTTSGDILKRVAITDSARIRMSKKCYNELNLTSVINKLQLNAGNAFCLQRFDSLLAAYMPGTDFISALDTTEADSIFLWEPRMRRHGNLFAQSVTIDYPYNPLKRQLVRVTAEIPCHITLMHMGWQLAGSLMLIALVTVCMAIQIKTILKQKKIDEMRQNFVNAMIHELKRPVQTLKMCVAFLRDKSMCTDSQQTDDVTESIKDEVEKLSAYMQKLHDMTRTDERKTLLAIRCFDLRPVLDKLVSQQQYPEGKHVEFYTDFDSSLQVTADPVHLANVVSNLLENSIKYSGDSVRISVQCHLKDKRLCIQVSDNGIGIPATEQGRVFEKFYRSASVQSRGIPGIGLGLSYVKLITEAHMGTVSLSSTPGQGTIVRIEIPQP